MTDWLLNLREMIDQFIGAPVELDSKAMKRQRILEAARELIIQHGYRLTSIQAVADRAGVAKGTLYLYFKNKAELLMHVIAEEKKLYLVRLREVFEGDPPPREQLQRYIRIALVLANEMPIVSKLIRGDREILMFLDEMDTEVRERIVELQVGFFAAMLEQAAAPQKLSHEELQERSRVMIGLLHLAGLLADESSRYGLPAERFAELLADIVVNGLARGGQ